MTDKERTMYRKAISLLLAAIRQPKLTTMQREELESMCERILFDGDNTKAGAA